MFLIHNCDCNNEIDYSTELINIYIDVFNRINNIIKNYKDYKLEVNCQYNHPKKGLYFSVHLLYKNENVLNTCGKLYKSKNCVFMKRLKAFENDIKSNYLSHLIEKDLLLNDFNDFKKSPSKNAFKV